MVGIIRRVPAALAVTVVLVLGLAPAARAVPAGVAGCGTLGSAGTYVLSADLAAAGSTCLRVTAGHVTLDLGGHSVSCAGGGFAGSCQVDGLGPQGIDVAPGLTGVTVKGPGTISGFDVGVLAVGGALTVKGVTVDGPACDPAACARPLSNGILVLGGLGDDGPEEGPADAVLVGNHVRNQARGIGMVAVRCPAGGTCTVNGNTAEHDTGAADCLGIVLSDVTAYTVVQNSLHDNGSADCFLAAGLAVGDGSTGVTVVNNDASHNLAFGIGIGPGTSGNTVVSNTARGNGAVDLIAVPGTANAWSDSNRCETEAGAVPPSVCNPGE